MTTTAIVLLVFALVVILLAAIFVIKIACESCDDDRASGFIAALLAVGICGAMVLTLAAVDTASHIVETKTRPKVDTTIVIQNGVADTTFTYKFNQK